MISSTFTLLYNKYIDVFIFFYLSQLKLILSALGGGMAVGSGILISRAYGEGNLTLVRKRVSSLYAICLGVGILMLVGILPFTGQFLRFADRKSVV